MDIASSVCRDVSDPCPWPIVSLSLLFQSKDGKSPLHMTAVHGRFTRSQTLIQNGKRPLLHSPV